MPWLYPRRMRRRIHSFTVSWTNHRLVLRAYRRNTGGFHDETHFHKGMPNPEARLAVLTAGVNQVEAESAETAVLGAIADACGAIPAATLIDASPDLVGLTDVADLLDVSRQNVRKLILESDVVSPTPVHEGRPTIWHLLMVLRWLQDHKDYSVPEELLDVAQTAMLVNIALSQKAADRMGAGTLQHELAACAV